MQVVHLFDDLMRPWMVDDYAHPSGSDNVLRGL